MRTIILFIIISVFVSCYPSSHKIAGDSKLLEGYWIPDSISWLSPESGEPGIDTIIRYANFQTLCFDKENRFYVFQSTQNRPRNYDSLIFESEPGISLYKGEWHFIDSTNIMVNYKFKEGSFKKGTFEKTLNIVDNGTAKSLFFNGNTYKQTYLFDKQSIRKMDAYKAEWLPN